MRNKTKDSQSTMTSDKFKVNIFLLIIAYWVSQAW